MTPLVLGALALALILSFAVAPCMAGGPAGAFAPTSPEEVLRGLVRDIRRTAGKPFILLAVALVNAGAALYISRILQSGTAVKYGGWGTGTTTAAITQSALVTETSSATTLGTRTTGTESATTVTNTGDNYNVAYTMTSNGTQTISETGTFTAASAGTMGMRANFTGLPLAVNDAIAFNTGWTLTAVAA